MRKLILGLTISFGLIVSVGIQHNANAGVPGYDPSVFMPVPKLCPSGMSYYTACEEMGIGCNPDGCHDND